MSFMKWIGMLSPNGTGIRSGTSEVWPDGTERYFGLENFGNTCYCNSVLQALYFCRPFRTCVANYPDLLASSKAQGLGISGSGNGSTLTHRSLASIRMNSSPSIPTSSPSTTATSSTTSSISSTVSPSSSSSSPPSSSASSTSEIASSIPSPGPSALETPLPMEDNLFRALKDLFRKIETQKRKSGVVSPDVFVQKLRRLNQLFSGTMHQDAHEFLNYTLNTIAEDVLKYEKELAAHRARLEGSTTSSGADGSSEGDSKDPEASHQMTWVHQLFEGILTNETRCLTCESVTNRDESFLDLSIDIEKHLSVSACLRAFSASEMLCHRNKFYCDTCGSLQEAEKRMKIKRLPRVLALHLKRFKYVESMGRYVKLGFRVAFPMELRLFNTTDDTEDPDRLYELFAVVVHVGGGPHHGHYVSLVRSMNRWLLFDDDSVDMVDEAEIPNYFGGDHSSLGSGYVLFYQMAENTTTLSDLARDQN